MSGTDIHRPAWVLYQDPSMREHFTESHDHRRGGCDLGEFLATFGQGGWPRTRCRVHWLSELRICACELCSQRSARRRARRQERHSTRRALHEAAAQYAADDLDEDGPRPHRADAW